MARSSTVITTRRWVGMIVLCGLSTTRAEQIGALPQESPLFIPQLLGAQYTGIDQHQFSLRSPYAGTLSLDPRGDTQRSHTFGVYLGVKLPALWLE